MIINAVKVQWFHEYGTRYMKLNTIRLQRNRRIQHTRAHTRKKNGIMLY